MGRLTIGTLLVFGLGLAVAVGAMPHGKNPWPVPAEAKKRKNPVPPTQAAWSVVKPVYADKCVQCHGETGKGDGPESVMYSVKPADFTDAHMMAEMTDGEIFYKISEGRQPMPGFKKQLTEEQRWQLVHFVRTFVQQAAQKKSAPHKH